MSVLNGGFKIIKHVDEISFNDNVKVSSNYIKKQSELTGVENILYGETFVVRGIIISGTGVVNIIVQNLEKDTCLHFVLNKDMEVHDQCTHAKDFKGIKVFRKVV